MAKYKKSHVIMFVDELCKISAKSTVPPKLQSEYKKQLVEMICGVLSYVDDVYGEDEDQKQKDGTEYLSRLVNSTDDIFKDGYALVEIPMLVPNEVLLGLSLGGISGLINSLSHVQGGVVMAFAVKFLEIADGLGLVPEGFTSLEEAMKARTEQLKANGISGSSGKIVDDPDVAMSILEQWDHKKENKN